MAQFYVSPTFRNFSKNLFLVFILFILHITKISAQNCTVNAGVLNVTICETDALVLTGNNPSPIIGTVSWTQISGPAVVIDTPNSASTIVTGYTGGNTYIFRYSATCADGILTYQDKVVNVQPITIANAGGNIASCPNSTGNLSITANTPQNTGETGSWEIVGANNAGVVINFPNLPTSTITLPATSCGVTTLQWVIEGPEYAPGQRCRTTSQITVTNYGGVTPVSAGPDQTLSNCYTTTQSTNLSGTYGGCGLNGQNGQWTFVSGPNTPTIGSPSSSNTQVSNLVEGTYTFRWTVTGPCASGNDLVIINVPAATQDVTTLPGGDENIFFCDNTITQVTLVAQTPLYAGETVQWTQISGDPGAVIVSPTNPTTLVTNISDSGDPYKFRYTLTNNNTGCVFTKDYNVQFNGATRTIVANNGNDIVGSCNATVFTIPLTVTGTGVNQYRIVTGPDNSPLGPFPTPLQDVGNSLTLTLTTSGGYTVEFIRSQNGTLPVGCDYGFDTLNILVSGDPVPSNAGSDVSLPCGDTSTILSGVITDEGMHFWSQLSGPNEAIIADNFAIDTQVTGLIPGTYVFQYITKGGGATCGFSVSTVTIYVSDSTLGTTDAGPNQVVCANAQVQLAGEPVQGGEIGTWSQISGPNTISFSNVNDPNAVATGFTSNVSQYELQWTVSYLHPGPSCSSAISDTVTIITNNSTASSNSDAGPDACYPAGTTSFNLSGNTPGIFEIGLWSVTPSTGVIFADSSDPNTLVTVPGNGTYVFTWSIETATRLCAPNKSDVTVTIANTPPAANAGPDQEICGSTITMAATISSGAVGTWTRISGVGGYTISDIHDPNAVFTFTYSGYYIFRWTVDAEVCGEAFDDINLTIGIPPHQAVAGPDQNICNNTSVAMAGSTYDSFFETGQWSVLTGAPNQPTIVDPTNPNTVINGLVAGTYTFRWTITAKSIFLCQGTFDDIIVVVSPTANAGADQTYCDVTSIQLKGNENSTGTWTLTSTSGNPAAVTITQSPPNSYIANATVVPGTSYVFTYTTTSTTFPDGSTCAGSSDSVNVEIFSGASVPPDAGSDQTLCISDVAGTATLQGNVPPPDVTVFEWRFAFQPPGSVAVITTPTAPLTTVTGLTVPGLYILEWVFESPSCRTLSDIVRIEMNAAPSTADAGPDDAVACQTTYQTDAVPPAVGIGTWSITSQPAGAAAVIDTPNSPTTTLSNVTVLGTYTLTWTVTNGPFTNPSLCQPSSDTVDITFNDDPPTVANAGPDQELCDESSVSMVANSPVIGTGTWTQVSGPNTALISAPNNPNSLMLGLIAGTYEFNWTIATTGCTSSDTVLITIYNLPSTANAGPNQIIPQFSPVNMDASVPTIGTGTWTQVSGPSIIGFTNASSPSTAVTGTVAGIYVLQWTVSNGNCAVSSDTMNLTILSVADLELTKSVTPVTGSAGDTVTFNIQIFNNNSLGGTVSATGVSVRDYIPLGYTIVPGSVNLAGIYNLGDNTITWNNLTVPVGGRVNLTFQAVIKTTGSYVNNAEIIASDQFDPDSTPNNNIATEDDQDDASIILDVADLSLQKTVSPATVSINDNVIFTIRVTNSGPNNATGITVSDHLPPGYTYVSDNGAGKYNNATGIWNVGNLNNGNSLALQITAKVNVVSTGNDYINVAEIQTAHQLDPDSTPGNGLPEDDMSSANVSLKQADLELTKSVTPTSAAAGQQVDFTLNVLNRGPGNATGVDVQDVIPVGYTLIPGSVSSGGTYQIATATLEWKDLYLPANSNVNLTFSALVNPLGNYLNIAQITASDLPDPDSTPNNNIASEDDQDDAEITFIGPSADLSLVKNVVAGNTSPVVGSQVSFELVISNDGPNNATGVQVTDLLPSGYQYVNYSSSAGLYNSATGVWNVGTVDVGVSESLILDAKVLPTGNYLNITQVTASNLPDPDSTPNNDDGDQSEDDEDNAVITPVQPSADLSLTKTVSNPTPLVGSVVTFTIITTNSGPQDAAQVQVTDLLPSGYTFTTFNATSGTYDSATGLWTLDILESSESETLQINAIVNPTGDYTNIAEVTNSDTPDPDSTPNNGISTEDDYGTATITPIQQSSDLSLAKTVNNSTPLVGSLVTFEVVVTNNGPQDNFGIQVTDVLPSGYTFTGFTVSTGTYDTNSGIWNVGNLVTGDSETLQIVARVNPTGDYTNTAEVTAANLPDPDSTPNNGITTENDYAEATTTPVPTSADLSLTKTVSNPTPLVGSLVTFSIQVTNSGPQEADGVTVTDLLPSGYTYVSYSATTGTYDSSTGLWDVGNMPVTDSYTLQITALVNAAGNYTNSAEITASSQPDPDSTPNNGITTEDDYAEASTTPIATSADLSLTKTVSNATPLVGSQVTFSLQVNNAGPQATDNVTVTDLLPSGYTYASYTATAGSYDALTGLWSVGSMPVASNHTLQITAVVNAAGNYTNTAEITASSQPDPDSTPNNGITTEDDYAEATTAPIVQSADLSLTKTVNNANPLVGSPVTFEVIVTNNGPQDTSGVTVTDLLPSGYTYSNFTISTGTYNPATGVWTVGNLINGKSETLQILAVVNPTGNYVNVAEVTSSALPDPDSTPNNGAAAEDDYATATVTPNTQSSDLSLTKTVDDPTPLLDTFVTFEIVVTNSGPQDNTGVKVTDLLPAGCYFQSYAVSKGTYNHMTGLWNVGNLGSGQSESLQIKALASAVGNYTNIAEVTAADLPDPDSAPNNAIPTEDDYATAQVTITAPNPPIQLSDLSLTKMVDNASPLVGSSVIFEVSLTNKGPRDNASVEVTDLLPSGYAFINYSATKGTYSGTTGKWNIGSLANGDSQTLRITATVNAAGNYENIAEVTASSLPDPNSTPNNGIPTEDDYGSALTVPIPPMADLSLVKTVVGGNLSPIFGATVTFEITVTNSGPQNATGVKVIDMLPSGYEYVVYSSTSGQYYNTTGIWDIGTIPNGASESLLIGAKVNNTGVYQNVAEVYASNEVDPDSTPNNGVTSEDDISSVLLSPVPAVADLSIEKKVINNILTPAVGSQITFSIIVTNNGPSIATGVTVKDILPSGYDYIFFNSTSGRYDPVTGIWNPNVILPGNSHTLLLNVFVKSPTGTPDEYLNITEIMTADQHDPDSTPGNGVTTEDDYDSISVTPVIVMADLSIKKTALNQDAIHDVGSTVIFTVTVTNDGPADASGVRVKDLLPPGFTYQTSSPTSGLYNYVTGIWNVGNIPTGTDQSLDIYTTVNKPSGIAGEYTNITEVIASNLPDPDSTPNNGVTTEDDYDSLQIKIAVADLSLEKTASNKNANVDEVVTFTLQLNNEGPSIATGVAVEDIIPLGYKNISNINNGGIFSLNTIKWVNLTVPVGGISLTYQATVASPLGLESVDYVNIAQVTASNQFDPDSTPNNDNGDQSEDDEDSESINIPSTDIAINKEVDKTDVPMNTQVTFTISAENLGNLTATNVEVQDVLPKGYSLINSSASSGTYDQKTGIWSISSISTGALQTLILTVKVIDFNDYLNNAHLIKLDQIDTNSANNQDSATVSPNCLKIYNEFSPNDDGQNDFFYIDCIERYPDNQLEIFNRWGNLVYYQKGYKNTWDGKEEGSAKTLPEGTYFYILDLGDGSKKTSGWVYLK
ncbi:gliding motility-associated C-terminal domain-containing protein [Flavobacterium sp. SH_e]|uniref:PKD domain-containing protein n=1 Tax=Flavobacterium TaxID=237 RepID=UPI0021E4C9D7|nr:gliding motility-associated C-terminal domain-containing protein [Flavobacterium sp. SH_e]MCV2485268.1 gliding motility-associated C-terminal domain-containing protein [Flavobacterium sp. SH_e]